MTRALGVAVITACALLTAAAHAAAQAPATPLPGWEQPPANPEGATTNGSPSNAPQAQPAPQSDAWGALVTTGRQAEAEPSGSARLRFGGHFGVGIEGFYLTCDSPYLNGYRNSYGGLYGGYNVYSARLSDAFGGAVVGAYRYGLGELVTIETSVRLGVGNVNESITEDRYPFSSGETRYEGTSTRANTQLLIDLSLRGGVRVYFGRYPIYGLVGTRVSFSNSDGYNESMFLLGIGPEIGLGAHLGADEQFEFSVRGGPTVRDGELAFDVGFQALYWL